jgi:hypothetical protein
MKTSLFLPQWNGGLLPRTGSSGDKSARKMTETEFVDAE